MDIMYALMLITKDGDCNLYNEDNDITLTWDIGDILREGGKFVNNDSFMVHMNFDENEFFDGKPRLFPTSHGAFFYAQGTFREYLLEGARFVVVEVSENGDYFINASALIDCMSQNLMELSFELEDLRYEIENQ